MENKPELIAKRFKIGDLIGIGGLSSVYLGQDLETKEQVAIKLLKPEIVKREPTIIARFKREATMLEELDHPNIVKYITSGEDGDHHYIIMEYLSGGTLAQRIREHENLSIQKVLEYGIDLTDALTRAHRLNIIHRDIKPTNIIFDDDNIPHITDFGIAHVQDETHLTQIGAILGSYTYLSPEACHAEQLDQRTDVWSLGVTLYEMLVGKTPFQEETPGAVVTAIINRPVPDIHALRPDIPEPLHKLIHEMLEKNRDNRIDSMRIVGARLENITRLIFTPTGSIPLTMTQSSRFNHGKPTAEFKIPSANPVITKESPAKLWRIISIVIPLLIGIAIGAFFIFQNQDSATSTPTDDSVIIAPVADAHYMILVADFEAIDTDERSVERFIYNDLQQTLERDLPYLNIELRQYPRVIQSKADALKIAETNNAAIIIWGNYTESQAEINVQVGSLVDFPYIQISRELLEDTLNIRLTSTAITTESVATNVVADLIVMYSANGETFSAATAILSLEELERDIVAITGNSTATHMHRYFANLLIDPQMSVDAMNTAIRSESSNPILYHFRGLAYQRLGNFTNSDQDLETAAIVSDDKWYVAYILRAGQAVVRNRPQQVVALIEPALGQNEDDWFIWFIRGSAYYVEGDYVNAESDLALSVEKHPTATFPYLTLAQIATRKGDIDEATSLLQTALNDYSDPDFLNRAMISIYGEESAEVLFYSYTLASYSNFLVGQYDLAIQNASAALEIDENFVDLYMLRGVSECSLDQYEDALLSYNKAIELDPEFYIMYLLRSEVLFKTGEFVTAINDIGVVQQSDQFDKLEPYIELGLAGGFNCSDFTRGRDLN